MSIVLDPCPRLGRETNLSDGLRTCTILGQWYLLPVNLVCLFIALLVCCACVGGSEECGPLVNDLLNDTPCAAPCWQGIVPGQTTGQEAIDILFSDTRPSYIAGSGPSHLDDEGEANVWWVTKRTRMPSGVSSASELNIRQNKVHHMYLSLDTGLTVQAVIDKWGIPAKMFVYTAGRHPPGVWANLCYPEKGIEFGVYLKSNDDSLALDPEDRVLRAGLYGSMTEEQWLNEPLNLDPWRLRPNDLNKILDWTGFGPIPPKVVTNW